MKKYFQLLFFILPVLLNAETPNFKMVGFATLKGGTTGGHGGEIVTPSTFNELKQYVESNVPYVIRVVKEFNTGVTTFVDEEGSIVNADTPDAIATTFGDILKIGSNKTLLGIGDMAFFNRIGLVVQCQSNIIIRNVRFTMKNVPATRDGEYKILDTDGITTIGDPDCIGIQADVESIPEEQRISQHIWVDHCEFYNEKSDNKDRYDGLLDSKNNVQNMTISWCFFHDHSKALLSGKGSSDDYNRTITYHHNYFYQIYGSRLPLLRFGQHHYFNNFMEDCEGDGVNLRINSNGYLERNYFKDSKKPVFGKSSEKGQGLLVENIFENCSRLHAGITNIDGAKSSPLSSSEEFTEACNFNPSDLYEYQDVLDDVAAVPEIVKAYSGVGVIQDFATEIVDVNAIIANVKTFKNTIMVQAKAGDEVHLYSIGGSMVYSTILTQNTSLIPYHSKGVFIITVNNGTLVTGQKLVLK